jgi:L-threonylcarbamoyladenylate synthase
MRTLIIKINPKKPERELIKIASDILKDSNLVAFPTETVYGLGARALDKSAVSKIFKAKGRKSDNPLIVHIANKGDLNKLAKNIPKVAYKLAKEFWPGPLTLVLEKKSIIPNNVTSGLKTVAIRMPNNKIALELIKESGPIAAPSANISGRPSGTSFEHVLEDFNGKIDAVIEGEDSKIGLESTVISLVDKPVLLRPGYVTLEQLRRYLPDIQVHGSIKGERISGKVASPGMKYKHYSPKARVILANSDAEMENIKKKYSNERIKVVNIRSPRLLARNLFKIFRESDIKECDIIIVRTVKEKGIGLAIMNRLRKAALSK